MNKYVTLFLIAGILSIDIGCSQENKSVMKFGAGYYTDIITLNPGNTIWIEGGYIFNTGFRTNFRLSYASTHWTMDYGFFKGEKNLDLRIKADLTFSKPFKLGSSHIIEPGVGFLIRRLYYFSPKVEYINEQQLYISFGSENIDEIGCSFTLDYYYQFSNNIIIGIRTDANTILALGFEGLSISPIIGVRF